MENNNLRELTTEEITKRIREAMIYIFDCKKAYFSNVYVVAVKMAREVFKVTDERERYIIGCNVAKSYIDAHGQPEH
jgi:hypothetical protein